MDDRRRVVDVERSASRRALRTRSDRWYAGAVALLSLSVAAFAMTWAMVLAPFSGPDELAHYNSVVRLLDGGGWPAPGEARYLDASLTAYYETGGEFLGQSLDTIPAPEDRSTVLEGSQWDRSATDQMVQHPPGYYLLAAGATSLLGGEALRWDHAQLIMRFVSALLVAAAVPFLVGIARRLTGTALMGLAGGAFVLFVPFFSNNGGHISNDALLIPFSAAAVYFVIRALEDARPVLWLALSGVALGGALLSKGFALLLIPVVATLALWVVSRRGVPPLRRIGAVLLPLVIAFVVGGWWWLRNLLVLGKLQPSILGEREHSASAHPAYDLWEFVGNAVARLNATFWGRGARAELALPEAPVAIAGTLLVVLVVSAAVIARRSGVLVPYLLLLAFPALILATIISNAHGIYWDLGDQNRGIQGRYLFSGVGAMCVAVALWASVFAGRAGGSRAAATTATLLGIGGLVTSAAICWVIRSVFSRAGMTTVWSALEERHGIGAPCLFAVAAIAEAALVAAMILAARSQRERLV